MSCKLGLPHTSPSAPACRGRSRKVSDAIAPRRHRLSPVHAISVSLPGTASSSSPPEPTRHGKEGADLGWRTDFDTAFAKGTVLGQGSFGVVHLGLDLIEGHEVAIKIMPKIRNRLPKDKTLEKVVRETEILERLQSCKSVVQLKDCFEDDANVALVMEYCGGGDLQKFVDTNGPLDEVRLALVAREVLKVVDACHEMAILHGDVKPANFCLKDARRNPLVDMDNVINDVEPWLKALDFGCSQHLFSHKRMTKRTGTPVYMAPEIYGRDYSRAVDIWGMGVMLYWLFSDRFPFFPDAGAIKASKLEDVTYAVCHGSIDFDYEPWLSMSPEGLDFMQGCLNRDENARLTVPQALGHPWLKQLPKSGSSLRDMVARAA